MLSSVAIWAVITATDVAADLAETKVKPLSANFQAIFTAIGAGGDKPNFRQMFTSFHIIVTSPA